MPASPLENGPQHRNGQARSLYLKRILFSLAAATLAATPALATDDWRVIKVRDTYTSFYRKVDHTGDIRRFDTTRIRTSSGQIPPGDYVIPAEMDCTRPRFRMVATGHGQWLNIPANSNGVRMRRHICS